MVKMHQYNDVLKRKGLVVLSECGTSYATYATTCIVAPVTIIMLSKLPHAVRIIQSAVSINRTRMSYIALGNVVSNYFGNVLFTLVKKFETIISSQLTIGNFHF